MKRSYLGDSYDAVKRMWQELLSDWAPLYAEPRFIPKDLRHDFTKLTRIQMLSDQHLTAYSILNDPCTGIRLPNEPNQSEGQTHISIWTIIAQLKHGARCVVTFDQSHYRNIKLKLNEQRQAKLREIADKKCFSFYYVSHAPFLFAFPDENALHRVDRILEAAGIPRNRIEKIT